MSGLGHGGPSLPQKRRLVTTIPGPRSHELAARRTATVARGVASTLPVFITRAGGGVLVDVDGKPAGIPSDTWTNLLVYRKDLFEKAGLQTPDTLDKILALGKVTLCWEIILPEYRIVAEVEGKAVAHSICSSLPRRRARSSAARRESRARRTLDSR